MSVDIPADRMCDTAQHFTVRLTVKHSLLRNYLESIVKHINYNQSPLHQI